MEPISPDGLRKIAEFRHDLHAHPELSGQERETAARVVAFLQDYRPDLLLTGVGGHGVVAVFDSGKPGRTVVLRCELDALPIDEPGTFSHRSTRAGVSHKCGHDGHAAIVAGMAVWIAEHGLKAGRVVLLFQPAEESGEGARAVLADPRFLDLRPDAFFAFHNLPKVPLHQVVVRDGVFACASVGMLVRLRGSSSHSSYPEHGRSPARALAELIGSFAALAGPPPDPANLRLVTVTQAELGDLSHKVDFGVAPGSARLMAVLRAAEQEALDELKRTAHAIAVDVAERHGMEIEVTLHEEFASTRNDARAVAQVREAAVRVGLAVTEAALPFRWSEDVGLFLQHVPGALFGLGAGEEHPQLHNEAYDFPDALIPSGIALYAALIGH